MSESRFPLRTILFVSLAANLLVIGAAVGAYAAGMRLERHGPAGAIERAPGPRALMAALAPESRAEFREALVRTWLSSRELRGASRRARRELFEAASAEPYDVEHVRTAFAHMRDADQATLAAFHDAVAVALGELDASERRDVLERLAAAQRQRAPSRRRLLEEKAP